MLTGRRGQRDERGGAALLVAFVSLILFSLAALTVDLGNALARKGDTQIQADLAALAGAEHVPATKALDDPAVIAVSEYLNANQSQG